MLFSEGTGTTYMIGMFVGEEQGGYILWFSLDMFQTLFENARTNTNINQNACLFAFNIDGVAFTTTGEYGKLKNSPPLSACRPEPI